MPDTKWDAKRWSLSEGKLAVLHASANESARHVRGLYVTFLLFAFYIAVIVFATTDEQLLRETGARLPLLNVELPLLGFYIFIPWLVLIFHVHLLNQFFLLSRKLHNVNRAIASLPEDIQHNHRELPFPLVFSHMIIGTHHSGLLRWAFSLAVILTVVIVPITLLLAIQWKFLPYHSSGITRNHRIILGLDLLLLWTFWPRMFARSVRWGVWCPSRGLEWRVQRRRQLIRMLTAGVSTMVVLVVSALLLVLPDNGIEYFLDEEAKQAWQKQVWRERSQEESEEAWLNDIFHRNLDLREKTLMRQEPPPELIATYKEASDPSEKVWLDYGKPLDLQRRDLRNADFFEAKLWDADLRGADLRGTDFQGAQLQGADLRGADLRGAIFWRAQLQGAALRSARLQGADFRDAQLQGADLREANLQGADFQDAQLQGADLRSARLQGAALWRAQLQGADLRSANLQGADLRGAKIYATDFARANLSMVDIRGLVSVPVSWNGESFKTMERLESRLTFIIAAENEPEDAQERVQRALFHFWDIAFNPPLDKTLPTSSQATDALYNHCGLFADWPPPSDIDVFEINYAPFLANFSCDNEYVARTTVIRALLDESRILAQALLSNAALKTCSELTAVVKEARKRLEKIAQQAK